MMVAANAKQSACLIIAVGLTVALEFGGINEFASAQDTKQLPVAAKPLPGTAAPPANAPAAVALPNADKIVLLVRSTMLTLNDALQTGNFSVLRERGSPNFQMVTSAEQLAQAFAKIRAMQVDLIGVAITVPQLTTVPTVDAQNHLRITGFLPGQPLQFNFDIQYEPVDGQWRLFALAVNPTTPQVAQSASAPAPVQKKTQPSAPVNAADKKK